MTRVVTGGKRVNSNKLLVRLRNSADSYLTNKELADSKDSDQDFQLL